MVLISGCSKREHELVWHREHGYRWASVSHGGSGVGFKLLKPERTGITFENHVSKDDIADNRFLLNGSGVAAGDINGDGLPDLYFTQLDGPNALYENLGNMHFRNITKEAGVALPDYYCTGTVFADVNGDGKLDLLVSTYNHGTILFLNQGDNHFKRDPNSGLDSTTTGGTTMTLADINGDGFLDLYVAHYRRRTVRDLFVPNKLAAGNVLEIHGKGIRIKKKFRRYYTLINSTDGPQLRETGTTDELYLNKGGIGKAWKGFQKVKNPKDHFLSDTGKKVGLDKGWGLTARFVDLNNDGLPDLYVCNDYWTPDHFWINQGNGVFKQVNPLHFRHYSFSSMSVAAGDVNNDGYTDLLVTDMLSPLHSRRLHDKQSVDPFPVHAGEITNQPQYTRNTLYINRGDNTYTETARYSGIAATGWSWASMFMDVNLDGREDILINDGYLYNVLDMDTQLHLSMRYRQDPNNLERYRRGILLFPHLKLINRAFENNGNLTFTNVSQKWGFHQRDVSQGMALADLNNDGVLDLITNRMNESAGIYKNITGAPGIAVRLIGDSPNTQAIGARVILRGGPQLQDKQVVSGGNYLSGSDTELMFAAGKRKQNRTLTIYWRDGKKSVIDSVKTNRIYEINESKVATVEGRLNPPHHSNPVFEDISDHLHFTEHEDNYNDYKRQPLLPLKLSQEGPGMAWIDYNDDGRPDLFETSGKGSHLAVFKNEGHGRFQKVAFSQLKGAIRGDQTAVIGWRTARGTEVVVGRSDYEQKKPGGASAYTYLFRGGHIVKVDSLPGSDASTGPLAAADYNEDGTVDLFVGGRVIPGKYPKPTSSRLYKNIDGRFVLDKTNNKILKNIGLVTGAVFTDYNRDGWPDLLVSTSWGSLKLFENDHGHFHDVTNQVGLNIYKGWWNGVATGDFNNDGYPDIVATNMGLNSRYHVVSGHQMRMYYGQLGSNGVMDIIQANYDTAMGTYAPMQPYTHFSSLKMMGFRVRSYKEFAQSSLQKIVGPMLDVIPYRQINTLQSMVFINRGGKHFMAVPLPRAAQLTDGLDASVGDFNNDGNEDIFLSQNLFDMPASDARLDGGRGLWLKGDGKGDFKPVPGFVSGIKVYGEQRGAALGDFNNDGKVDLAVSQNGAETKLYLNTIAKRGYSIHLNGPARNRNAVGSSIRLLYHDGTKGPRREIQVGSGYWSQNSFTQVLGYDSGKKPAGIVVSWFDGSRETVKIEKHKMDYRINYPGNK